MNWLCPKCRRAVSLAYAQCPVCGSEPEEVTAKPPARAQPVKAAATGWADVKRGFRFGVGFLLAMGIMLFGLAAILFLMGHSDWLNRALAWLGRFGL